jgi:glycosyltransferase involved in cell wall biosynthesis
MVFMAQQSKETLNSKLLIIQPWFTASGHPAQSAINTAKALHNNSFISFLISEESKPGPWKFMADKLRSIALTETYKVPSSSLRTSTLLVLIHLANVFRRKKMIKHIFFLDAHLVTLAALWFLFANFIRLRQLSMLYLIGPERIYGNIITRLIVSRFLKRKEVRLFLRTEELMNAWLHYFPDVPYTHISVLPSLELWDQTNHLIKLPEPKSVLHFGVLGQVRPGKGIEWLVPLFVENPEIGILTIAGTFNDARHRESLSLIRNYRYFTDRFHTEEEFDLIAQKQDYLLMLYDKWDKRMEGAILYVAARNNRPVIVFDGGWCARMVRNFGCGLVAPNSTDKMHAFLMNLPRTTDESYRNMIEGLERFRTVHTGEIVQKILLNKLLEEI